VELDPVGDREFGGGREAELTGFEGLHDDGEGPAFEVGPDVDHHGLGNVGTEEDVVLLPVDDVRVRLRPVGEVERAEAALVLDEARFFRGQGPLQFMGLVVDQVLEMDDRALDIPVGMVCEVPALIRRGQVHRALGDLRGVHR
jgi:hypothetical protein